MSDGATGSILEVLPDGSFRISLAPGETAEVGERFAVLDENQEPIALIKVVLMDSSGPVARSFQPFVSDDTLAQATGAATGAAIGTIIGSLFNLGVAGAPIGAIVGNVLARRKPKKEIESGMRISLIISPGAPAVEVK